MKYLDQSEPGPVELDVGEELRWVAGDGLAPVLAADLLAPPQDELTDEPKGDAHCKPNVLT